MKQLHALTLAALISAFSAAASAQGGEVFFYGAIVEGGCSAQTHALSQQESAKSALELNECASPAALTLSDQQAALSVHKGQNSYTSRQLLRGATAHAGAVNLTVAYF
ncbi:hypothetical protein DK842_14030 [Chromobacterium phragmitis]|uniref:Type 1 fimbrial protein n=1 Tax=Chromobacterium phragmitis TaxID=2202141 RepID=A0A344UM09_9NEIS|nr:hypothetical protein [Chromobacterium phragmitis]AXE30910.1 hypothetical protein DK842_14030 [Chromobacterium phragmitis]AXE36307.1 hypothetical protein DK843_19600 [Chromobacterium phragmitis]